MLPKLGIFVAMRLATYLSANQISVEDFASLLGEVSASGVTKWVRGERVPRPDQMRRIAELTGGQVKPNDFILDEVSQ